MIKLKYLDYFYVIFKKVISRVDSFLNLTYFNLNVSLSLK
jgi:hypothetical protein